jgi:hypothetical protein
MVVTAQSTRMSQAGRIERPVKPLAEDGKKF